jgi:hypothetical protein
MGTERIPRPLIRMTQYVEGYVRMLNDVYINVYVKCCIVCMENVTCMRYYAKGMCIILITHGVSYRSWCMSLQNVILCVITHNHEVMRNYALSLYP